MRSTIHHSTSTSSENQKQYMPNRPRPFSCKCNAMYGSPTREAVVVGMGRGLWAMSGGGYKMRCVYLQQHAVHLPTDMRQRRSRARTRIHKKKKKWRDVYIYILPSRARYHITFMYVVLYPSVLITLERRWAVRGSIMHIASPEAAASSRKQHWRRRRR